MAMGNESITYFLAGLPTFKKNVHLHANFGGKGLGTTMFSVALKMLWRLRKRP